MEDYDLYIEQHLVNEQEQFFLNLKKLTEVAIKLHSTVFELHMNNMNTKINIESIEHLNKIIKSIEDSNNNLKKIKEKIN
jgi:L-ribulose-5-phosphate 3-epimerase UlaE